MNGNYGITSYRATYFDGFGVEHIAKQIEKFIGNKRMIASIYRMLACNSLMCGYFRIGFINFTLKGESLLDYTNLLSPNEYETI